MPKNATNATKTRTYKVQTDTYHIPFFSVKGKFLQSLGMGGGTQFEMIETDNLLIFRKMTDGENSFKEFSKLRNTFKRCFNLCERHLETYLFDEQINQEEHLQFLNHLKQCGIVATTLYALSLNDTRKSKVFDTINEFKRQLAWCEQLFIEDDKTVLVSFDLPQLETYKHLLGLLRDCGKKFGIFTKRNLFSFKHKRHLFNINGHKAYYRHNVNPMMVAENRSLTYNVDDEISNHHKKYSKLNQQNKTTGGIA